MTSSPSLSRPVQRLDLSTEGRDDYIGLAVVLDHASGALVDRAVGEAYLAVAVGGLEHVVLRQLFGRQHSLHETARTRDHGQIVDRGDRLARALPSRGPAGTLSRLHCRCISVSMASSSRSRSGP